jgi:hypothetical protein
MHRFHRQYFIILDGEHDDRHVGRVLHDSTKRFRAAAVGKVQIQQHDGGRFPAEGGEAIRQPVDAVDVHRSLAFDQPKAYQVGIAGVVFNQQYVRGLVIHYSPCVAGLQSRTRTPQLI